MKVIGTEAFLPKNLADIMREYGYKGTHNQFRIICKCRGIKDANQKCIEAGFFNDIFYRGYTSETANEKELELCEQKEIWIAVDGVGISRQYVSAEELFSRLSEKKTSAEA